MVRIHLGADSLIPYTPLVGSDLLRLVDLGKGLETVQRGAEIGARTGRSLGDGIFFRLGPPLKDHPPPHPPIRNQRHEIGPN